MSVAYDEEPWVSGDEDGHVFVPVTAKTRTLAEAKAFLVENADGAGYDPETYRIDPDKVELWRFDVCVYGSRDRVPDTLPVAGELSQGVEAWWAFESLSDAATEDPVKAAARDAEWALLAARREEEARLYPRDRDTVEAAARALYERDVGPTYAKQFPWPGVAGYERFMDQARAVLDAVPSRPGGEGWRPFSTAPESHEPPILVYRPDAGVFTAHFRWPEPEAGEPPDDDPANWRWFTVEGEDLTGDLPTHWMPLPPEPGASPAPARRRSPGGT